MSAPPRPWNEMPRIEQIRHRWGRSWVEITQDQDVTHDAVEDTRWLLNAFAPLLAVARAADDALLAAMARDERLDPAFVDALTRLDREHPGWKEWTA